MKRIYLTLSLMVLIGFRAFAQTTLTVDANGVLNFTKLVAQTTGGQNFFTGHQLGSTIHCHPAYLEPSLIMPMEPQIISTRALPTGLPISA